MDLVQRRRERHARSDDRSARKALVAGPARDSMLTQTRALSTPPLPRGD